MVVKSLIDPSKYNRFKQEARYKFLSLEDPTLNESSIAMSTENKQLKKVASYIGNKNR